eukprot:6188478-Pleurochrysis_carterae.AAC.2
MLSAPSSDSDFKSMPMLVHALGWCVSRHSTSHYNIESVKTSRCLQAAPSRFEKEPIAVSVEVSIDVSIDVDMRLQPLTAMTR